MTSKALEAAGVMFERALSQIDGSAPIAAKLKWTAKIIRAYAENITEEMAEAGVIAEMDHAMETPSGSFAHGIKAAILKGLEP